MAESPSFVELLAQLDANAGAAVREIVSPCTQKPIALARWLLHDQGEDPRGALPQPREHTRP
jgi:hypothetical protein